MVSVDSEEAAGVRSGELRRLQVASIPMIICCQKKNRGARRERAGVAALSCFSPSSSPNLIV